jgi:hypothetical protein
MHQPEHAVPPPAEPPANDAPPLENAAAPEPAPLSQVAGTPAPEVRKPLYGGRTPRVHASKIPLSQADERTAARAFARCVARFFCYPADVAKVLRVRAGHSSCLPRTSALPSSRTSRRRSTTPRTRCAGCYPTTFFSFRAEQRARRGRARSRSRARSSRVRPFLLLFSVPLLSVGWLGGATG